MLPLISEYHLSWLQVQSLADKSRFYKKSAAFCLRSVSRHSPDLALAVVDSGAVDSLVSCLEDFDPAVRQTAASALGSIGSHSTELADKVRDSRGS